MELSLELICRPLIAGLLGAVTASTGLTGPKKPDSGPTSSYVWQRLVHARIAIRILRCHTRGGYSFRPGTRGRRKWISGIGFTEPDDHQFTDNSCAADHCCRTMGHFGHRAGYRRRTIRLGIALRPLPCWGWNC